MTADELREKVTSQLNAPMDFWLTDYPEMAARRERRRKVLSKIIVVGLTILSFIFMYGCKDAAEPDVCTGYPVMTQVFVNAAGDTLILRGCNGTTWAGAPT